MVLAVESKWLSCESCCLELDSVGRMFLAGRLVCLVECCDTDHVSHSKHGSASPPIVNVGWVLGVKLLALLGCAIPHRPRSSLAQ